MRAIWLTAILALQVATGALAEPAPAPRTEIPVKEVTLSDGMRRYTIPIRVGSVAIEAGLDSGSTGLRILPGVVSDSDASASHQASTYAYGSGAKYEGVTGQAVVSIGDLSAATPVQLIRSVGCTERRPHCPVSRVSARDYGIQGDGLPGEGFKAIVGVNMAEAEIPNPLVSLGAKRWILELPRPGDTTPGRLILNPTAEEMAGYTFFHVDPTFDRQRGGLHDAIPGCLINRDTKQTICGPAVMDSGAPGLRIVTPRHMPVWPNDTPATLVFAENGKPQIGANFVVGRRAQASHFMVDEEEAAPGPRLYLGLMPYFAFSVLYDPAQGRIGLKPREGDLSAR